MATSVAPTRVERFFPADDIIVSKTDLKGRITYANDTFCKVAEYREAELLGQPHSIIRHPDMPRAVFKFLWDRLAERQEVFAYVKNMSKHGHFYWVFAHVTPSYNDRLDVIGYHSSRRVPRAEVVKGTIEPLYAKLLGIEQSHRNGKDALAASFAALVATIGAMNVSYDEFVLTL
jgi:PAS domain S-box-containing protein